MSRIAALVALIFIPIAAACDKVALLAPTDSVITLSINTTTLPVNGTAEVFATVIEPSGTPVHDGTVVTFTSTVGVMEPREARTEGGIARATFRANGQSGTARITAFSGGARVDEPLEVLVGGAAANAVTVRTEPTSVPATGGTVEVIAVVVDVSGNPLPGAPVVFTANNGVLSSNSAVTDAGGQARVSLTTSRETTVRAAVAGKEGTATVTLVTLPTVTVTASTPTPAVGVPVVFTITPSAATNTNNPVQSITFDPGDGTGPRQLPGSNSPTSFPYVYSSEGAYTATATIVDTTGLRNQGSTGVFVQRAFPTVTISASPNPVAPGASTTISVSSAAGSIGGVTGPPVRYVDVSFSDGQSPARVGPGSGTVSRTFTAPGTYTARATAVDAAGTATETSTTIVVRATTFP